jgi:hypothetical protein
MDADKKDTPEIKIKFRGEAYPAKPLTEGQMVVLSTLGKGQDQAALSMRLIMRVLAVSVGPDLWDEWTDQLVTGEASAGDFAKAIRSLIKATGDQAGTPDSDA